LAAGEVAARLEAVVDWKDPIREGVVYYLREAPFRGVLLWKPWWRVDAARAPIAQLGPLRPQDRNGRLPA